MWRYIPGVNNPSKKLKTDEKRDRDKAYEKEERNRKFLDQWKIGRPWLIYDNDQELMRCSICVTHVKSDIDKKSSFVVGCSNLRLETIT